MKVTFIEAILYGTLIVLYSSQASARFFNLAVLAKKWLFCRNPSDAGYFLSIANQNKNVSLCNIGIEF